ncbi:MAG: hypothetical protein ABSE27_03100 [Acidobacteriaceae bacterium]
MNLALAGTGARARVSAMNHARSEKDEFARKLWLFFWPLVFVVGMTVLSECGPQLFSSAASTPVASQQATQSIR